MALTELEKQSVAHLKDRPRRLRATPALRAMVRETELNARDLIYPMFVRHGQGRNEIRSMPGVFQLSVDEAVREASQAAELGVPAVILFGLPAEKDPLGLENFAPDGIVQQAIRAIKKELPELVVVTDVCLCEYTDHGHCGILNTGAHYHPGLPEGYVLNDETLDVLARVALSHADCGADIVAPSGMIDGMVAAIRTALDANDFPTCRSCLMRSNMPRHFMGHSAKPPTALRVLATARVTRWTPGMLTRPCAKPRWMWPRAPTC